MVVNYTEGSTKSPTWIDELSTNCLELQDSVENCCKLCVLDEDLLIILHADDSVYGVGGYRFQDKDGKRIPIQFLNEQLHTTERKWKIAENEMLTSNLF